MDVYSFLIQCLNALQYGLLLFLVARGLTLIFGIMGIINLAHGSFYMIGAYMAFSLSSLTGSLFLAIVRRRRARRWRSACVLEWALFSRLYKRDHLEQVLLTYGLILVFEELRSLIVGNDVHGVAVPAIFNGSIPLTATLSYPVYRLFMSAVCIVLAVLLYLLIAKTRARHDDPRRRVESRDGVVARNQHQSRLSAGVRARRRARGVRRACSPRRCRRSIPAWARACSSSASSSSSIGGIGSVWGALVAALLIGLADTFGKVLLPEVAGVIVYLLMAAILLWRPEGLFRRI